MSAGRGSAVDAASADAQGERSPRRFWMRLAALAMLLVLLPTGIAYLVSAQQDEVFGARSDLVFLGGSQQVPQRADQQLRTQTVLITSRAYLIPTAREFDVPVYELEERVTVERLQDSEILQLTVTAEDPDVARRLASSLVDTYVGNVGAVETTEQEQELLTSQIQELRARQEVVDARLAVLSSIRVDRRAAGLADPITSEQTRLESETRTLSQQIADLQDQLTELRLDDLSQQPAVRVVTPAYVLEEPLAPNPLRAAAAGALVGLLLAGGVVVAALRLRLER